MDDGGQRLLDVIEDPHVLETLLRESFSSSALEDSPRFDNVSSSTDSGLVSSGLDNLVFDGQLVEPLRGGSSHSSHHAHTVTPHVLQQVLHSPNLSAASILSGGNSHQLHHHQLHQAQQVQPPLLSQHTSQHQSSNQSLSNLTGTLETECAVRGRDSCPVRNEPDHQALQQLLSSSPINTSQQILQLHHPHQQQHPQGPGTIHQSQQAINNSLQIHSQPSSTPVSHLGTIPSHSSQPNSVNSVVHPPAPQQPLPPPPTSAASSQISARSTLLQQQQSAQQQTHQVNSQQQPPHHHHQPQQQRQQLSSHVNKSQPQQQSSSDISTGILSLGFQSNAGRNSNLRLNSIQSPPTPSSNQLSQIATHESAHKSSALISTSSSLKPTAATSIQSTVVQAGTQNVSGRVQLVGSSSQVLPSGAQIIASGSQIIPGATQILPSGSTHVLPGGAIFSAPNVIPGGQVLSNVPSGQVFQGGQLIPGAQVLANHLLNTSQLTTISGIAATPATPLYVTPPIGSHIQPSLSLVSQSAVLSSVQASSSSSSSTITSNLPSIPSVTHTSLSSLGSSTFQLPNKSPASLPRTSPVPYSATPSPHHTAPSPSYANRSPAPSPHSLPGSLRSPAPLPPSPTVTSQSTTIVTSNSLTGVSSMVGGVGMVQGLVSHLPLQSVGGTNGVVLTQGGNPIQVASGLKQVVPGGQLIQLVSSPQSNQVRQPVVHPIPKPIQPKQPQLLPKPTTQAIVRQPTPPPPGKTLVGSRPNPPSTQQPIVIGNGGHAPTVITGQHNLGSIVLNSSLIPAGLQQPLLIPQPNGMQLLVRPTAAPSVAASQGQTLLVPVPGQSQVTSVGKVSAQPQTLVIPGSGQTPALVIPQGLAPTIAGGNVFGTAQGTTRSAQPIIRLLAPQAPLQLQQINTPTGPTWVAVPTQTTLNLPGVFATPPGTVRALAPQVAPGTIQLAPSSINPPSAVGMSSIQIPGGQLQVSSSQPLHLTISNSLPTAINTTTSTCRIVTEDNASNLSSTTTTSHIPLSVASQHSIPEKAKKKSKKKKKEKESKEDKKGKGVSINLNELLKETGIVSEMIFEDGEFGDLGMESTESVMVATSDNLNPSATCVLPMVNSVAASTVSPPQPIINQPTKMSTPSLTVIQGPTLNVASSVPQPSVSSLPSSMCLTLDSQGKLVLGSTDIGKSVITSATPTTGAPIMASQIGSPLHLISTGGITNTSSAFIFTTPDSSNIQTSSSSVTPINQLVTLHSQNEGSPILKIDVPSQLTQKSNSPKTHHLNNEMTKVAQNTQLLHTLQPDKIQIATTSSILNNILIPPSVTNSANIANALPASMSVNLISNNDKGMHNLMMGNKKLPEPSVNIPLEPTTTCMTQLPPSSSAVIVSANLANNILPGAKGANFSQTFEVINASHSSSLPIGNLNYSMQKRETPSTPIPISMQIVENSVKNNTYQNQYLASVKNHAIMESCKPKKSSKKKKKDKEIKESVTLLNSIELANDKNTNSATNQLQFNTQVVLTNGNTGSLIGASTNLNRSDVENPKAEDPLVLNSNSAPSLVPLNFQPPGVSLGLGPVVPVITTSNASTSTVSNIIPMAASSVSSTSKPAIANPSGLPNSPNSAVPGSFVFTGQQVLLQPGQQVKQLLISPQNQEALKRVQTQIQSIQSKKGPVTEQDKLFHQKLISEQKKIVATGKPVAISPNALSQPQQPSVPPQRSPVKYSHAVGHKKIFFSPSASQKKIGQCSPQKDIKYSEQNKDIRLKNSEIVRLGDSTTLSSNSIISSQVSPAITSFASMTTTITTTSPSLSTPVSNVCLQTSNSQQFISSIRVNEVVKNLDQESRQGSIGSGSLSIPEGSRAFFSTPATTNVANNSSTTGPYTSVGPVSIILSSSKPIPVSNISPVFSASSGPQLAVPQTIPSGSSSLTSSSTQSILNNMSSSQQGVQNASIILSPRQPSPSKSGNPVTQIATQIHSTAISPSRPNQHVSFSLPLTRDQLFEHQLRTDQNGALNPDFRTPFKNKIDGCKRLIRYHVFDDAGPSQSELLESDYQFEVQSENLTKKFSCMLQKYKSLLLRESMRRHPSSENVMLYRLFNQEEKMNFEREKTELKSGRESSIIMNPSDWVTNVDPLPDFTFPWEDNWPLEKAFVLNPNSNNLEEIGVELEEDSLEEEESTASEQNEFHCEDQSDEKPLTDWEEVDEPRLQIMVEEFEGEDTKLSSEESQLSEEQFINQNDKFNDVSSSKFFSSCDSDSVQSPASDPCQTNNDILVNRNHKTEGLKSNHSLYRNSKENKGYGHWSLTSDTKSSASACLSQLNYSDVKENGIDNNTHGLKNNLCFGSHSEFFMDANNKKYNDNLSPLEPFYNSHKGESRTDKNKRDRKYRTEKEKRKHEKSKDKNRNRDKDLIKSSKKLRIKFKPEDTATVPPLRIRTDERGSGGLKLTLKKQEGSSDYYRVGEELKDYKVKHKESENSLISFSANKHPHLQHPKAHQVPDNSNMQKVSVVLQNCLQTDWKCKRELEDSTSLKRSKRLKSHVQHQPPSPLHGSINETYEYSSVSSEKDVNLPTWSSSGEKWQRHSGNSSFSSPPSSSIPSNTLFYHSSPHLPRDRSNPSQTNFIPYSQAQSHKNSQLS